MTLTTLRNQAPHEIPDALKDIKTLVCSEGKILPVDDAVASDFPHTKNVPFITFKRGEERNTQPMRVGVVFSGGQASGGHNVVIGLYQALIELNKESKLFGFLNGPKGIINGDMVELTEEKMAPYYNQGGFDLIGSGRDKIQKEQDFLGAKRAALENQLTAIVIIGGDDSNTNAALLAEYFLRENVSCQVIGVPKTIDGDLKNEFIEISFGFDTATKIYSETIGNLARDALSQKKYFFFIKLMGRSASHIALECALQTHPNVCLIGEELAAKKVTLDQLIEDLRQAILKRQEEGKNYGVILIPEGIIEFLPDVKALIHELNTSKTLSPSALKTFDAIPEEVQKQLTLDRDPHGNVQVSKIETERLLLSALQKKIKFSGQPYFLGYEGRSCPPSFFDGAYSEALGRVCAVLISQGKTAMMAIVQNLKGPLANWTPAGLPLVPLIHFEERKGKKVPVIQKALVNLEGELFQSFAKMREKWLIEDAFYYPGPIQYFGPEELVRNRAKTIGC